MVYAYAHIAHEEKTQVGTFSEYCVLWSDVQYPTVQIEDPWWSGAVRECDTSIVSAPLLTWGQHKHRAQAATLQVSQQWPRASPSTAPRQLAPCKRSGCDGSKSRALLP